MPSPPRRAAATGTAKARQGRPTWAGGRATIHEGHYMRLRVSCSLSAPYFSGNLIEAKGGLIETR